MEDFSTFNKLQEQDFHITEYIQNLWSGYGQIVRLTDQSNHSLVAKFINPPIEEDLKARHNTRLRTANSSVSHQRKLKSYQVELQFYQHYGHLCDVGCKVPKAVSIESRANTHLIVMEDLSNIGYPIVRSTIDAEQIKPALDWLANFHALFLNNEGDGLWPMGTYWHLATRQEEHDLMKDGMLKQYATEIDTMLNATKYQTLVHGDAKLANFCFGLNGEKVAAVDFQYVGRGCGMKDVIYFFGSCLSDQECERMAPILLDQYFYSLSKALKVHHPETNCQELEKEWRIMYPIAWADFHRFLKGWMPTHQKLTAYSEAQVGLALANFR